MIRFISFLFACIIVSQAFTQHTNVKIEKPQDGSYFASPCEPSVVINPFNPAEMMIGSVLDGVHFSQDTGKTWMSHLMKSPLGVEGDPCVLIDADARYHYFHLSNPENQGRLCCMVHQKTDSVNGEWSEGVSIGDNPKKIHDKEWGVVDLASNTVYLFWTVFDAYKSTNPKDESNIVFSKYNREKDQWTKPLQLNNVSGDCQDGDFSMEGTSPAIGPNGELYVAWCGGHKIWLDRSLDGGKSWMKSDNIIADQPGGWRFEIPGINRCNGFPVLVCDTLTHKGNMYIVWSDQRNGKSNTDILFSCSKDKGETWSTPKVVNTDHTKSHQFFPWMAVDQKTGNIYVVFYDRRNYNDNNTDVYLAWSDDEGRSFNDFRISKSPFMPDKEMFFGDYTGLSAWNNIIRPVWTRLDGYSLSLWTSLIDVNKLGVDHKAEVVIYSGDEAGIEIINSWDMSFECFSIWNEIKNEWFKKIYWPALKKHDLKMECSECEYVYLDAVFYIDLEGKLVKFDIEKSNVCGKEADEFFKMELITWFIQYIFPKEFHNKAFRVKLGTGLKC